MYLENPLLVCHYPLFLTLDIKVYRRVYEVEIVDGVTIPVRSEVIRERNWKGTKDDLTDLQELTSNNIPSEGIVVLDDLRVGVMEYTDPKDPSTATGQRIF